MERKRQKPSPSADTLQEAPATKHAKLVLKPPKFLTAKAKETEPEAVSSLLERVCELETAEDVLEHLLGLLDSHALDFLMEQQWKGAWSQEEVGRCIGNIGKLAKTYREDVCVCCVLVHVVEMLGVKLSGESEGLLPKNFQLFALSLLDHGKYFG